jgi:hypothetical protein
METYQAMQPEWNADLRGFCLYCIMAVSENLEVEE